MRQTYAFARRDGTPRSRGAGYPRHREQNSQAAANLPRPNTRSRSSAAALSNAVVAARTASTLARAAFTAGRSLILATQAVVCGNLAAAVSPRNAGRLRDHGKVAISATL